MRRIFSLIIIAIAAVTVGSPLVAQTDTMFTYQGELNDNGSPATGDYNMEFSLWDSDVGGTAIGGFSLVVPVVDGKFTAELDFGGAAFDNMARWLEIEVSGVPLSPRTPITRAPYAIQTRGIFVDEAENVGIGTTEPQTELDVNGGGQFSDVLFLVGPPNETFGALGMGYFPSAESVDFGVSGPGGGRLVMSMNTAIERQWVEIYGLGVRDLFGEEFGIADFTHRLNVKTESDDNALRLMGPDGNFQHGARINFGDEDFVYLDEDEDDSLTIFTVNRTAIMGGDVGIATTTPGFTLEVNGTAGKPGGGPWAVSSDRRLKKNISPMQGSLDKLMQLQGVTYEYIDPDSINELEGLRIGMIAQEVERVFPDWVDKRHDGYKAVTFRGFEALTVEALRELRVEKDNQIANLKAEQDAELATMRADHEVEVAELRERMVELERMVAQLAVAGEEK